MKLRPITKVLAGLGCALVVLALGEAALRLAVPLRWLQFSHEREDGFLVFIDESSYRFHDAFFARPDFNQTRGGLLYRTNSVGFRESKEIPRRCPADTYCILAIGDSWIYGLAQPQGQTMADHLERLLPGKLGVKRVEVINAGVPGSSAFDMLRRWQSLSENYQVHGLLLSTSHNQNRQAKTLAARQRWYASVGGAPYVDVRLYLLVRRLLVPLTRSGSSPRGGAARPSDSRDMAAMVTDARRRGLQVWMLLAPSWHEREELTRPELNAVNAAHVKKLGPLGVKFGGHALRQRACYGSHDKTHPGPAGARVMAEVMAEVIATGVSRPVQVERPACGRAAGKK